MRYLVEEGNSNDIKAFLEVPEHAEHINDGDNNEPIMITLSSNETHYRIKGKDRAFVIKLSCD